MDYQKQYNLLIDRARNRLLETYTEKHHIVPKCMNGSNDVSNLVALTAREHFLAHLLLAKIYGGKLWHAANMMSNFKQYTSRNYDWVRKNHALEISKLNKGEKCYWYGKKRPKETKNKISKNSAKSRPCIVDGKEFSSLKAANMHYYGHCYKNYSVLRKNHTVLMLQK